MYSVSIAFVLAPIASISLQLLTFFQPFWYRAFLARNDNNSFNCEYKRKVEMEIFVNNITIEE